MTAYPSIPELLDLCLHVIVSNAWIAACVGSTCIGLCIVEHTVIDKMYRGTHSYSQTWTEKLLLLFLTM